MSLILPEVSKRPCHVAIIMDGNGRWAHEHGLPRLQGHQQGAEVVRDITTFAREIGISYLTLYTFSVQNWRRPLDEVAGLMILLRDFCHRERATLDENDIRFRTIGELSHLPEETRRAVTNLTAATASHSAMTMTLALDYGGREELVVAAQRLAREVQAGRLNPEAIDEATLASHLHTASQPDPDLVIRTSGESRVSNFLLWQIAYAELHFTKVRWPEFSRRDFVLALQDFASRERRFGGLCDTEKNHNGTDPMPEVEVQQVESLRRPDITDKGAHPCY